MKTVRRDFLKMLSIAPAAVAVGALKAEAAWKSVGDSTPRHWPPKIPAPPDPPYSSMGSAMRLYLADYPWIARVRDEPMRLAWTFFTPVIELEQVISITYPEELGVRVGGAREILELASSELYRAAGGAPYFGTPKPVHRPDGYRPITLRRSPADRFTSIIESYD